MTLPIDSRIPADQAMLLRVIDAKFETTNAKLEGIASTLTAMNERFSQYDKRFDDHEHRLSEIESHMEARKLLVADFTATKSKLDKIDDRTVKLESWQIEQQTTSRNAGKWGGFIWGACGTGLISFFVFLATMYFQAQPKVVDHRATGVEHVEPSKVTADTKTVMRLH